MNEAGHDSDNEKRINCFNCEHYANTWNPKFPRACKFFGFKSAQMPSDSVYASTGEHCNSFKKKNRKEA
jgi:hypothetical protein